MQKIIDYTHMNRIFIPSIMHTGTIFTRNLIAYATYKYFMIYLWNEKDKIKIVDNIEKDNIYYVNDVLNLIKLIKTNHFDFLLSKNLNANDGIGVIHTHIAYTKEIREEFLPNDYTVALMHTFKTVIPIRDPLASIITRYKRQLNLNEENRINCKDIVNGFCLFAKYFHKDIHFILPVDLHEKDTIENRVKILQELFDYIGINPGIGYINKINKWKRENVFFRDYQIKNNKPMELQNLVNNNDIEKIKERIKPDYDYLKSKESIIKPFLKLLGYKNLLWWD